jgi:hypothetical protein
MRIFHTTASAFALALLVTACGGDDVPDPAAGTDRPAAAPAAEEAAAAPSADRGEGTLRLGETTYRFAVRACDFGGETDDMYQTLSGRGTTPEGEPFDVFVSRNDAGGMLVHTVSFQTGDVRRGAGTVLEAQRMRHGTGWMSTRGGPAEPLIRIDGNRLTASGRFTSDDDPDLAADGTIEATCR